MRKTRHRPHHRHPNSRVSSATRIKETKEEARILPSLSSVPSPSKETKKKYCLSMSPFDENAKSLPKWRLMFGEIFMTAAFILAKHRENPSDENYSVFIGCDKFDTVGKEKDIYQLYTFFLKIFNAHGINAKILIDSQAILILGELIDSNYSLESKGVKDEHPTGRYVATFNDEKYYFQSKSEYNNLLKLAKGKLVFSEEIVEPLKAHLEKLDGHIGAKIKDINVLKGRVVFLVLRKRGTSPYDKNRKDYEVTTADFLRGIIEGIVYVNLSPRDEDKKIRTIFLIGDSDQINDKGFFRNGCTDSPHDVLKKASADLNYVVLDNKCGDICDECFGNRNLQFLVQAYFTKRLIEKYNVITIGPYSGGTYMPAILGSPVLFPVNTDNSSRFVVQDERLAKKSLFYLVKSDMSDFKDTLTKVLHDPTHSHVSNSLMSEDKKREDDKDVKDESAAKLSSSQRLRKAPPSVAGIPAGSAHDLEKHGLFGNNRNKGAHTSMSGKNESKSIPLSRNPRAFNNE